MASTFIKNYLKINQNITKIMRKQVRQQDSKTSLSERPATNGDRRSRASVCNIYMCFMIYDILAWTRALNARSEVEQSLVFSKCSGSEQPL